MQSRQTRLSLKRQPAAAVDLQIERLWPPLQRQLLSSRIHQYQKPVQLNLKGKSQMEVEYGSDLREGRWREGDKEGGKTESLTF